MASLKKTMNSCYPTSIEGIYVRDIALSKIKELEDTVQQHLEDGAPLEVQMLTFFKTVVVDKDNNLFDDVQDEEGVAEFGAISAQKVVDACMKVLRGDSKNSEVPG